LWDFSISINLEANGADYVRINSLVATSISLEYVAIYCRLDDNDWPSYYGDVATKTDLMKLYKNRHNNLASESITFATPSNPQYPD